MSYAINKAILHIVEALKLIVASEAQDAGAEHTAKICAEINKAEFAVFAKMSKGKK